MINVRCCTGISSFQHYELKSLAVSFFLQPCQHILSTMCFFKFLCFPKPHMKKRICTLFYFDFECPKVFKLHQVFYLSQIRKCFLVFRGVSHSYGMNYNIKAIWISKEDMQKAVDAINKASALLKTVKVKNHQFVSSRVNSMTRNTYLL